LILIQRTKNGMFVLAFFLLVRTWHFWLVGHF